MSEIDYCVGQNVSPELAERHAQRLDSILAIFTRLVTEARKIRREEQDDIPDGLVTDTIRHLGLGVVDMENAYFRLKAARRALPEASA
jgi:hypothetical protein